MGSPPKPTAPGATQKLTGSLNCQLLTTEFELCCHFVGGTGSRLFSLLCAAVQRAERQQKERKKQEIKTQAASLRGGVATSERPLRWRSKRLASLLCSLLSEEGENIPRGRVVSYDNTALRSGYGLLEP